MTLKATKKELLEIFPRELPGLDLVTEINTKTDLSLVYLQRDVYDPGRDWPAYEAWRNKKISNTSVKDLPFPKNIDGIHDICFGLVQQKKISRKDKIILEAYLIDQENTQTNEVYLSSITRNKDPGLSGLGSEFYQSLVRWLKQRGYGFLTLNPDPKKPHLKDFWAEQGTLTIGQLAEETKDLLFNPNFFDSDFRIHDLSQMQ